jgi:hypothetical protein
MENMKKQRDAVVEAVITVLGSNFVTNETIVEDVITTEQRKEARQIVFDGIINNEIKYSKDTSDEKAVRKYCNNVVDNYIRRAKEFNAGQTYKPKKEGTKRDPKLKALNALISTGKVVEGTEDYNNVISSIETRKEELAAERSSKSPKKVEIDLNSLPAGLQDIARNNLD